MDRTKPRQEKVAFSIHLLLFLLYCEEEIALVGVVGIVLVSISGQQTGGN